MNHECTQAKTIGELKEAVRGLTEWQKRQNGALQRLEDKISQLLWLTIGALIAAVMNLLT